MALVLCGCLSLCGATVEECPTWFYHPLQNKSECVCGSKMGGIIECSNSTKQVLLMKTFCVTYYNDSNETLVVGRCYNSQHYALSPEIQTYFYKLPHNASDLDHAICRSQRRTGRLCGKCINDHYTPTYSYDFKCVQCISSIYNSVMQYIGIAYVPLTLFAVVIFIFRINILSPQLNCVVVICQIVTTQIFLRGFINRDHDPYIRFFATVYGIWNLDFFRTIIPPICLPLGPLYVVLLDYLVAFYPLVLLLTLYNFMRAYQRNVRLVVCLFKPLVRVSLCFKRQWDIKSSFIDAFASFIVLSFMKTLTTSADLLICVNVRDIHSNWKGHYLYIDPSYTYFGRDHLPFAICAIVLSSVWIVFGIGLLLLYPMQWFQVCLNRFGFNSHTLRTYMQCFQGYYRDRTDGGMECRYFAVVYPALRCGFFVVFSYTHDVVTSPLIAALLIIIALLIVFCKPYRHPFHYQNNLDVFLLLSLSMIFVLKSTFLVEFSLSAPNRTLHFMNYLTGIIGCIPLIYLVLLCIKFVAKTLIPIFKGRQLYVTLN